MAASLVMKIQRPVRGRKTTIHNKLTFSYFMIITLMALVLSLSIMATAFTGYSREMRKLNTMYLQQAAGILESRVLAPVNDAIVSVSLGTGYQSRLADLQDGEALAKIAVLCKEMSAKISLSPGVIAGIHVYFKQGDFIASSAMGYIENTAINRRLWPDMRWFEEPLQYPGSGTLTFTRTLHYHRTAEPVSVVTFVSPHPMTMTYAGASAVIALDVPLGRLSAMLTGISDVDGRVMQLYDTAGRLILGSRDVAGAPAITDMGYENNTAFALAEGEGVFIALEGTQMLRSGALLPNGWLIVSHVPVTTYFAVNRTFAIITLAITLVTVLLFLLISRLFARRFLAPLEHLLARARQLIDRMEWTTASKDELSQVDAVLTEMDTKLAALRRDWEDNLPTLKLAFMRAVTEGESMSRQSFDRQLRYYARSMADARYRIMLLYVSPGEDESLQHTNEALISYLEGGGAGETQYIAHERSVDCICVLAMSSGEMARSRMYGIIQYAGRTLHADVTIAAGGECHSPEDIRLSFEQALAAYERQYFEEEKNVFVFEPLPAPEGALDEKLREDVTLFREILEKGDHDELETHLQICLERIAAARLAPNAKHDLLMDYVSVIRGRMPSGDGSVLPSQSSRDFSGISAFSAWLIQAGKLLITRRDGESRSKEAVESVVAYINANLSEDLSLTRLSEYTMFSNNYLSRIFKEHMGVNLVDYITKCRMAKAAEMLSGTRLPIEQIGHAVGYNTPHYFSRRFREYSGLTPNQYRLR